MKKITLASCLLFVIALFVSSRWATAVVSAQPPLIGLSTQAPILGRSFLSTNGGATFTRRNDLISDSHSLLRRFLQYRKLIELLPGVR